MKRIFIAAAFILFVAFVQAQNVGIGTSTPTEKLHVAGNIKSDTVKTNVVKITPNAGAGKVLTSDATGNANWQTNNATAAGNAGFGVWGDCATNGNISDYNPVADATGAASDQFGSSVSVSGSYAIVGAYADNVGANSFQGSASIFQLTAGSWVLMNKITDAAGATFDVFGSSVSISGNYAIVGAPLDDVGTNTDQGSASIYKLSAGSWVFMQKLTYVNGNVGDKFGKSVSISGNYAVVGTPDDDVAGNADQGSASIYQFNGTSWVYITTIAEAAVSPNDRFGISVSISANYIIVGAYNDAIGANAGQGSASIFQLSAGSWVFMQKITDFSGESGDVFGNSVSISGNYAIVGAYTDDVLTNTNQGSASIFQLSAGIWVLMNKITDANGAAFDQFGQSVSISGNYAMVGADKYGIGANNNQGSAIIYVRVGLGWQKLQYVTDPAGVGGDFFGYSTSIDANNQRFIIGAQNYANGSGKVIFGKVN